MTRPVFFVEEDKILTALFEEGLDNLHLSKPGSSPIYSERLLSLLPEESYSKITVHDHYYLKAEYRLAGIHLDDGHAELPAGYRGRFSRTCCDVAELPAMKRKAEYVFLRGALGTSNEGGVGGCAVPPEVEQAARRGIIDRHVYAFGGINLDNIGLARELGFGGVVVCEDLWGRFDIYNETDYKNLISHFEKLRKAVS